MKTLFLSLILILVFVFNSSAQYCGNSGGSICVPSGTLGTDGFTPSQDIPCLVRGQFIQQVIQYKNFTTVLGGSVMVQAITIDSISNLPTGLCWSTNKTNNSFTAGESGCILITGSTNAPPGQYQLQVYVTMVTPVITVQGELSQLSQQYGIPGYYKIRLRVIDQLFPNCPPLDSNQQVPFTPFSGFYENLTGIKGKMFFDVNQNNILDIGEQPLSSQLVSIGNGYVAITNQSGDYYAYPLPGVYTIKPRLSQIFFGMSIVPDSLIVHADNATVAYPDNNFAVIPPANYCAGTLSIVAVNPPPRPGFNNQVALQFHNSLSTSAISQTVRFNFDARQVFHHSAPTPTLVDTINHFIQWNVTGINSGAVWAAYSEFYTPPTVAINTLLNFSALVSNSSCSPLDTLTAYHETQVVGSYDPNDKSVSPVGDGNSGRVLPSTLLTYTVRFQNTGTYAAQNVKVVDTISEHLNISSLQVLSASHNYEVWISGREVNFMFSNINLPDSNANEPLSHGYIQYSIKPANSFVQNTVIENLADIYFDFNTPIRTNTVRNTADNFTGIETAAAEFTFDVFPNPLSFGNWQLTVSDSYIGKPYTIYDATGKRLFTSPVNDKTSVIETQKLSAGVYFLHLNGYVKRIVKL